MKLSISQLKYVKSLHLGKFRQKYHNFMVEGSKIAAEVLADGSMAVEAIFATPEWASSYAGLSGQAAGEVHIISPEELKKISALATPNQVLMIIKQPDYQLNSFQPKGLSLYLDDIRDPGNFGTILRIADWFGIRWVFCSENSVDLFNPKTIQASMGAFLRVNCLSLPFSSLKKEWPGLPAYAAVLGGTSIFEQNFSSPALLVIGNESKGISEGLLPLIEHKISIPKGDGGGAESLNAAVAAGILCAQFFSKK
jgi:TrmH family RNA methyltransferase